MQNHIFKVQLALNPKDAPALIYNKDRSIIITEYLPKDILKLMKGRTKVYFECEFDLITEEFIIYKEVEPQDW